MIRGTIVRVCGPAPQAQDLHRALEIDTTLAWKLMRAAFDSDLFVAATYLPGPRGCSIFGKAAASVLDDQRVVERIEPLSDAYQRFIKLHAGDRDSFETMLLAHAEAGLSDVPLARRKEAFKANGGIWGVQTRLLGGMFFVRPNTEFPQMVDMVVMTGLVDLRCLRPHVEWPICWSRWSNDGGELRRTDGGIAVDPSNEPMSPPILREFCSKPLPSMRWADAADGQSACLLTDLGVGDTAMRTVTTAEYMPTVAPRFRDPKNTSAEFAVTVRAPAEMLLLDVLVEEDTFALVDREPEVAIVSRLHEATTPQRLLRHPRNLLPISEKVEVVRASPRSCEFQPWGELSNAYQSVSDRLGWSMDRFTLHRLILPFPILPSSVVMSFPLQEATPLSAARGTSLDASRV
ncbi:MAG: hypothetical protein AAGI30_01660 [Planctomycetota bacterium]